MELPSDQPYIGEGTHEAFSDIPAGAGQPAVCPGSFSSDAIKPMDNYGNGGWWTVEGHVKAVYQNNGFNLVILTDYGKICVVTLYNAYAPPVWVGEHVHLEYGGRINGDNEVNYAFKVWQLPEPKAAVPPPPPPPVVKHTYIVRDSYVVFGPNGIKYERRLKKGERPVK